MIDRGHALSVTKQAKSTGDARSTVYYVPRADEADRPAAHGVSLRRSADVARSVGCKGSKVSWRHVKTLMQRMGIEALYRRPRTTKPEPGHKIFPYLLRGLEITRPNQVWAMDITYIPMAKGFVYIAVVLDWFSRRVLSWKLSITMEAAVLRRDVGGSTRTPRQARDLQHGSGVAVHGRGVHRHAGEARHQDQHGRQRRLARQRVRRAALAICEVRGGLSARLRERQRGAGRDRPLSRSLQSPPPTLEP
jgi:putative transposase